MALSEKQLEKMYNASLECSIKLDIITKELEGSNEKFKDHGKRIRVVENEQSFLKGKLGAFVLFLTLCATIIINGLGWFVTHFWGGK